MFRVQDIDGMHELWSLSRGNSLVRVAILDGRVDYEHPCFVSARIKKLEIGGSRLQRSYSTASHGTAVAGLLFSKSYGDIDGICPDCNGLTADIFSFDRVDGPPQCSETLLAYAIDRMLQYEVDVINVSAGFRTDACVASALLNSALENCRKQGTLVVSPVGNGGSNGNSIPACVPGVLAVGSLDQSGRPSKFTNYAADYGDSALLAPGEYLACAAPFGMIAARSGTSYAAAVVSGVVAGLLSAARLSDRSVSATDIGELLRQTAVECPTDQSEIPFCCFVGRLDIPGAVQKIRMGGNNGERFV